MSIHVHFYREQSAVTLIQRMQHSKNRLCAETIAALLQTHRSWNALPDRNHVQCDRFNPLTWVRKKIHISCLNPIIYRHLLSDLVSYLEYHFINNNKKYYKDMYVISNISFVEHKRYFEDCW